MIATRHSAGGGDDLPLVSVSAAGESDPLSPQGQVANERLERTWARQLRLYERLGNGFDRADDFTDRVQTLIDRRQRGRQGCLCRASRAGRALRQRSRMRIQCMKAAKGIVNSHQGFDENGKVTDAEKAKETVQAMGEKLREIKDAMARRRQGASRSDPRISAKQIPDLRICQHPVRRS
ncbi:MAG: hypothetical protein MZV64_24265 [Ignavibacteriales bacterium]|nr:hypothetical protein [Ignavibacteriales bacterium]